MFPAHGAFKKIWHFSGNAARKACSSRIGNGPQIMAPISLALKSETCKRCSSCVMFQSGVRGELLMQTVWWWIKLVEVAAAADPTDLFPSRYVRPEYRVMKKG
jgi:hypothetical protein